MTDQNSLPDAEDTPSEHAARVQPHWDAYVRQYGPPEETRLSDMVSDLLHLGRQQGDIGSDPMVDGTADAFLEEVRETFLSETPTSAVPPRPERPASPEPPRVPPLSPGETERLLAYRQWLEHEHRPAPWWRRIVLLIAGLLARCGPEPCGCEEVWGEVRSGIHLRYQPSGPAACGVDLTRSTNDAGGVTCLGCQVVSTGRHAGDPPVA